MWLLGIELRTFGRAVSALNHQAISPALVALLNQITSFLYGEVHLSKCIPSSRVPREKSLPSSGVRGIFCRPCHFMWSTELSPRFPSQVCGFYCSIDTALLLFSRLRSDTNVKQFKRENVLGLERRLSGELCAGPENPDLNLTENKEHFQHGWPDRDASATSGVLTLQRLGKHQRNPPL